MTKQVEVIDRLDRPAITAAVAYGIENAAPVAAKYRDPETRALVMLDQAAYYAGLALQEYASEQLGVVSVIYEEDAMSKSRPTCLRHGAGSCLGAR